ncbi:hypothetical protein PVNG_05365 [Plasmodium vivax North Korean]|uniref:Uncharacterized protein n=1 Tax=Plasmodium vivax North Korean TaxID=1035514 RepID=A0A0J9TV28_PLAVI|nr:hypothetical protein PVNG_05365 [Plasmodium vivax North Korean]
MEDDCPKDLSRNRTESQRSENFSEEFTIYKIKNTLRTLDQPIGQNGGGNYFLNYYNWGDDNEEGKREGGFGSPSEEPPPPWEEVPSPCHSLSDGDELKSSEQGSTNKGSPSTVSGASNDLEAEGQGGYEGGRNAENRYNAEPLTEERTSCSSMNGGWSPRKGKCKKKNRDLPLASVTPNVATVQLVLKETLTYNDEVKYKLNLQEFYDFFSRIEEASVVGIIPTTDSKEEEKDADLIATHFVNLVCHQKSEQVELNDFTKNYLKNKMLFKKAEKGKTEKRCKYYYGLLAIEKLNFLINGGGKIYDENNDLVNLHCLEHVFPSHVKWEPSRFIYVHMLFAYNFIFFKNERILFLAVDSCNVIGRENLTTSCHFGLGKYHYGSSSKKGEAQSLTNYFHQFVHSSNRFYERTMGLEVALDGQNKGRGEVPTGGTPGRGADKGEKEESEESGGKSHTACPSIRKLYNELHTLRGGKWDKEAKWVETRVEMLMKTRMGKDCKSPHDEDPHLGIPPEEAHKPYGLFLHHAKERKTNERGIFNMREIKNERNYAVYKIYAFLFLLCDVIFYVQKTEVSFHTKPMAELHFVYVDNDTRDVMRKYNHYASLVKGNKSREKCRNGQKGDNGRLGEGENNQKGQKKEEGKKNGKGNVRMEYIYREGESDSSHNSHSSNSSDALCTSHVRDYYGEECERKLLSYAYSHYGMVEEIELRKMEKLIQKNIMKRVYPSGAGGGAVGGVGAVGATGGCLPNCSVLIVLNTPLEKTNWYEYQEQESNSKLEYFPFFKYNICKYAKKRGKQKEPNLRQQLRPNSNVKSSPFEKKTSSASLYNDLFSSICNDEHFDVSNFNYAHPAFSLDLFRKRVSRLVYKQGGSGLEASQGKGGTQMGLQMGLQMAEPSLSSSESISYGEPPRSNFLPRWILPLLHANSAINNLVRYISTYDIFYKCKKWNSSRFGVGPASISRTLSSVNIEHLLNHDERESAQNGEASTANNYTKGSTRSEGSSSEESSQGDTEKGVDPRTEETQKGNKKQSTEPQLMDEKKAHQDENKRSDLSGDHFSPSGDHHFETNESNMMYTPQREGRNTHEENEKRFSPLHREQTHTSGKISSLRNYLQNGAHVGGDHAKEGGVEPNVNPSSSNTHQFILPLDVDYYLTIECIDHITQQCHTNLPNSLQKHPLVVNLLDLIETFLLFLMNKGFYILQETEEFHKTVNYFHPFFLISLGEAEQVGQGPHRWMAEQEGVRKNMLICLFMERALLRKGQQGDYKFREYYLFMKWAQRKVGREDAGGGSEGSDFAENDAVESDTRHGDLRSGDNTNQLEGDNNDPAEGKKTKKEKISAPRGRSPLHECLPHVGENFTNVCESVPNVNCREDLKLLKKKSGKFFAHVETQKYNFRNDRMYRNFVNLELKRKYSNAVILKMSGDFSLYLSGADLCSVHRQRRSHYLFKNFVATYDGLFLYQVRDSPHLFLFLNVEYECFYGCRFFRSVDCQTGYSQTVEGVNAGRSSTSGGGSTNSSANSSGSVRSRGDDSSAQLKGNGAAKLTQAKKDARFRPKVLIKAEATKGNSHNSPKEDPDNGRRQQNKGDERNGSAQFSANHDDATNRERYNVTEFMGNNVLIKSMPFFESCPMHLASTNAQGNEAENTFARTSVRATPNRYEDACAYANARARANETHFAQRRGAKLSRIWVYTPVMKSVRWRAKICIPLPLTQLYKMKKKLEKDEYFEFKKMDQVKEDIFVYMFLTHSEILIPQHTLALLTYPSFFFICSKRLLCEVNGILRQHEKRNAEFLQLKKRNLLQCNPLEKKHSYEFSIHLDILGTSYGSPENKSVLSECKHDDPLSPEQGDSEAVEKPLGSAEKETHHPTNCNNRSKQKYVILPLEHFYPSAELSNYRISIDFTHLES